MLMKVFIAQLYSTLCDPMDCSPPGSSVQGSVQARIPEGVAIPFSRRSLQHRDRTQVSSIAGRFFTIWATRGAQWHSANIEWIGRPHGDSQDGRRDVGWGTSCAGPAFLTWFCHSEVETGGWPELPLCLGAFWLLFWEDWRSQQLRGPQGTSGWVGWGPC